MGVFRAKLELGTMGYSGIYETRSSEEAARRLSLEIAEGEYGPAAQARLSERALATEVETLLGGRYVPAATYLTGGSPHEVTFVGRAY